jgi:hypothetical protein
MELKNKGLALLATALVTSQAYAANTMYAPGDLVLYFQQEGGTNTVYANLGSATQYRGTASGVSDGTNALNITDLNSTLVSAFGAGWASDTTVYAGLAGVFSTNATANTVVDGDPFRTLYVSAARTGLGNVGEAGSAGYSVPSSTSMTQGASGITSQNNVFENNYEGAIAISTTDISGIDNQNPFLAPGVQDTAFGVFGGGVMQQGQAGDLGTFGDETNVEFALDLYRILAKTGLAGQVEGTLRESSYEGTITINSTGGVSFQAVPEPSSVAFLGMAASAALLRRRRSNA